MAPSHLYLNGKIVVRDVGKYQGTLGDAFAIWAKGSWRPDMPTNDIRMRNIGANGQVFDPALHPIQRAIYWGASGIITYESGHMIFVLAGGEE